MTVRQAAELTNLSEATWRAWVLKRKVKTVRLGRRVRIPLTELDRLVSEGTTPARTK